MLASMATVIAQQQRQEGAQAEIMAMIHQVMSVLQQEPVRNRARTLSMHEQVEPAGFNSQTTRVSLHTGQYTHINGVPPQVIANTTTSVVSFSILSPDASLAYDRIKLRLDEYRVLLDSKLEDIELHTVNGKTILCQKQANEMKEYLDQAEMLLQDTVESRDISAIVVLHRLRGLAEVLDNLKLYEECRLTGNCALDLSEALAQRSVAFRHDQAETLALIAGLSVYQPQARTLFTRAISIYKEVVTEDTSCSTKMSFLNALSRAGYWAENEPDLGVQWLGHAVHLITNELPPPTFVTAHFSSIIYYNYGNCLWAVKQYAEAVEVFQKSVSIRYTLASDDRMGYTYYLATALENMAVSLHDLGKYDAAAAAYKEALRHWRAEVAQSQSPSQCNAQLAKVLHKYGSTLQILGQDSEAAEILKEAVSLYHILVHKGEEDMSGYPYALHNYGWSCHLLGQHAEAVLAFRECIPIWRDLIIKDGQHTWSMANSLHDMAISLHSLGRHAAAHAAASKCIKLSGNKAHKGCQHEPNLDQCFVCQRVGGNTADPAEHAAERPIAGHLPSPLPPNICMWSSSSLPASGITPVASQAFAADARELPLIPQGQVAAFSPAISSGSSEVDANSLSQTKCPPGIVEMASQSPLGAPGAPKYKRRDGVIGWLEKKFTKAL
jgi:tetratricopeptide (TPR) repeat protein